MNLAGAIVYFGNILIYLLLIRAVMSWVVRDWSHPFPQLIHQLTEPLLMPMRSLFEQLGFNRSGIDFSFLATFLMIQFLAGILANLFR